MLFRKNAGFLALITALFMVSLVLGGCGQAPEASETKGEELTGSLTIAGSTSVQPVSELLAEAFMDENPQTRVRVQGGGSSAGITAAEGGAAEIGASSRDLKEDEKHLTEYIIAQDGIVIVVHPSNPVSDLSLEEVKNIYRGEITSWYELGGTDASLQVVTREEGSGTRGAFEEIVMEDEYITDRAIVQNSTGAIATTVAGDENAIGYISLAALDEKVKDLKIEGAEPTRENIVSGNYKVSRPFIYVTKGEPQGLAKSFIDFVMSPQAQGIIEEAGLVSVN
ncbi:MAG: phosphate ABC transporter substrate-binding protein [Candidatus Syntrophonatronum acetioxidans]|uniref:Phosphate-binding protein n=1 Tax=Candidatus Syntrophonatronum acetioxidans TaxID=1795816 RepID=A0A424YG44_9FIRM|nr:MAG: phosphate ABC transporter substrate-binding protein [Candidatus Syntrophonatronum acetioxidans]